MMSADIFIGPFAIAVPLLFGLGILRWIPEVRWASTLPARLALGHLIGCGVLAWVTTAYAVPSGRLTVIPVYVLLLGFAAVTWWKRDDLPTRGDLIERSPADRSVWQTMAIGAVVFGVAITTWAAISNDSLTMDANWNWALKAKAFFLAGSLNTIADGCCTHPNYPILIPLQSWWVYSHLHHVAEFWPKTIGLLFYLDGLALTFAVCRANMQSSWAWIVTAIVANDMTQVFNAPRGMADSAVADCILASTIFLAAYFARRDSASRAIALLMLATVLQTKNEGIAWAAFATAFIVIYELRSGLSKRAAASGLWILLAAAPWMLFKHVHRLTTAPEESMASLHTMRVEVFLRVKTIIVAHLVNMGPYSFPFLLVLCAPMIYYGWRWISKPVLALLAIQFASYLVIYFIVADQVHQLSFMLRALSHLSPALFCMSVIAWQAHKASQPEFAPTN